MRVVVNAAVSLDGRLALGGGKPLRLSGEVDLARVHRLRASVDAVLVGVNTVLSDDPSLLVKERYVPGVSRQPSRVVLDSRGRTPAGSRVLDGAAPCFLVTSRGAPPRALPPRVEVIVAGEPRVDLRAALAALEGRGVRSLLVEGGGAVIRSFLGEGLVDEMTLYVAPVLVGPGAPGLVGVPTASDEGGLLRMRVASAQPSGEGVLLRLLPEARA